MLKTLDLSRRQRRDIAEIGGRKRLRQIIIVQQNAGPYRQKTSGAAPARRGPVRLRQLAASSLNMLGSPNQTSVTPTNTLAAPQARVFIGLKVAPEIADELAQLAKCIEQPSVRLVAPADIHLTLVPPWNEASIPQAIDKLRQVASRFGACWLTFERVGYGPQPRRPRLLWAECAADDEIAGLRAALLEAFGQRDERPFQPHVTIARIREKGIAIARSHPIDWLLSLGQRVETVELFQSPPPGSTGYQVLASLPLGDAAVPRSNGAR